MTIETMSSAFVVDLSMMIINVWLVKVRHESVCDL